MDNKYKDLINTFNYEKYFDGDYGSRTTPTWVAEVVSSGDISFDDALYIKTKDGCKKINIDDYIIKNKDGYLSSCTRDEFENRDNKRVKNRNISNLSIGIDVDTKELDLALEKIKEMNKTLDSVLEKMELVKTTKKHI